MPSDSHLIELRSWKVWRWARLRGGGFAASRVSGFASPEATRAAGDLLARGEDVALRAALLDAMSRAAIEDDERLVEVSRDPRFAEAILWQNPSVYRHALRGLGRSRGAKRRKKLRAIGRYLQRYCTKNDTIGFFGPQGVAALSAAHKTQITSGERFLRRRRVYFEHWAISAIADHVAEAGSFSASLHPRLLPTMRLEGDVLVAPTGARHELPSSAAAILALCTGASSAREIAERVRASGELGDDDEIYETLQELVDANIVLWTLAIPTGLSRPEENLRAQLESIDSVAARTGLEALDRLEASRARIAAAAGAVDLLESALEELRVEFEAASNVSADRRPGQTYAGRTPVYEECLRDVDVVLGAEVIDAIAPGLELLLESARWYTAEVGSRGCRLGEATYERLAAELGSPTIRYLDLLTALARDDKLDAIAAEVTTELQERWASILDLDESSDAESASFRASELADRVRESFPAAGPGWPSARYHSPDILLAAASCADLAAGRFTPVLGEVHIAVNTCALPVVLDLLDEPRPMIEARERDLERPLVVPVVARDQATRADHNWRTSCDLSVELGATPSWRPRDQVMAVADLWVEKIDGEVRVRHRATRPGAPSEATFALAEVLDNRLSGAVIGRFDWLPNWAHRPRVTIDGFVVSRRRWRLSPTTWGTGKTAADVFLSVRKLAGVLGLPPRVFFKIPEEPKPIFVDLESPFWVDISARVIANASELVISEMLPDLDKAWLPVEGSGASTSEVRVVCVDNIPWRGRQG